MKTMLSKNAIEFASYYEIYCKTPSATIQVRYDTETNSFDDAIDTLFECVREDIEAYMSTHNLSEAEMREFLEAALCHAAEDENDNPVLF